MSRESGRTPRQVFGAMLRYYRERAELTRPELARHISKSVSLIQAIELGQRAATAEVTADLERVLAATRFRITAEQIDEQVAARLKRQEILAREDPPALWVILDEWVLRRPVGGRHVMQEQVSRLIAAAQQPHIMIEVIPADTGAHEGVAGAFAIADFADVPSVGYQEGAVGGQPVEEREDVASLDLTWSMLRADTLPRAASLTLLEEAAKSWTSAR